MNNEPTVKEHYIPRCYLKQFTINGEQIYQLDLSIGKAIPRPVSIKSICYEDNLYEFKDESGDFKYRNLIENILACYESKYSDVVKSISNKTKHKQNFKTLSFLTVEERNVLIIFMILQVLRDPLLIKMVKNEINSEWKDAITEASIHNLAIMSCLPIYKEIKPKDESMITNLIKKFENMSFIIGYAENDSFLTNDYPVILIHDDDIKNLEEVYFPLSSKLALYMRPRSKTPPGNRNKLKKFTADNIECVNNKIIKIAKRWIYSKTPFTEKQINRIINERK